MRSGWVWIGAAVLVLGALVAFVVVRGVTNAPLRQTSARTCVGCVSVHWDGTSSIRASRLSGGYAFRRDATWEIAFASGEVSIDGEALSPGCHLGESDEGAELRAEGARDVRIEVPAGPHPCEDAH